MSCFCRIAAQSGTLREDIAGHCTIVKGSGRGCRGCSGSRMQGGDTRVGDGALRESQSSRPSSLDGQCVCLCVETTSDYSSESTNSSLLLQMSRDSTYFTMHSSVLS